jgi:hypothetical protein
LLTCLYNQMSNIVGGPQPVIRRGGASDDIYDGRSSDTHLRHQMNPLLTDEDGMV